MDKPVGYEPSIPSSSLGEGAYIEQPRAGCIKGFKGTVLSDCPPQYCSLAQLAVATDSESVGSRFESWVGSGGYSPFNSGAYQTPVIQSVRVAKKA